MGNKIKFEGTDPYYNNDIKVFTSNVKLELKLNNKPVTFLLQL